jgi:hypothetical protein
MELRSYGKGVLVVGAAVISPCFVLVCKHCGYMAIVNAIAAGVVGQAGWEEVGDGE